MKLNERYMNIVRAALEKSGAISKQDRNACYERLVETNEKLIGRQASEEVAAAMRRELAACIAAIEAECEPVSEKELSSMRSGPVGSIILSLLAGAAVGAGLVFIGMNYVTPAASGLHDARALDGELAELQPQLAEAKAFLDEVRSYVESNTAEIGQTAAQRFVNLQDINPQLAEAAPELAAGGAVLMRADGTGYKILYRSPLCSVAKFLEPGMVDPIRDPNAVGCMHFGYWNEAGASF